MEKSGNIEELLLVFKFDPNQTTHKFEKYLTRFEREELHLLCQKHGLYHRSYGSGTQRRMTISKEPLEIEITDDDRKRFANDMKFPITVFREEIFLYQVEALDPLYGTKKAYESFKVTAEAVAALGKGFHAYVHEISNKMIEDLKALPAYKEFVANDSMPCKELPPEKKIYVNKPFTTTNWNDIRYISCDIRQANFNCLRFCDRSLVFDCATWAELVKKYTPYEYFETAKQFRQMVLGHLKAKKIQAIERHIMGELYHLIKDHMTVFGRIGSDEMIILTSVAKWEQDLAHLKKTMQEKLSDTVRSMWRVEAFSLKPLGNTEVFIKTNIETNAIEIKGIEKRFFLQAYRYYLGQKPTLEDMMGTENGVLVEYKEPFEFE
jgi:hypothetical protein